MSNGTLYREVCPVGFAEFPRQNPSQVEGFVLAGNPGNTSLLLRWRRPEVQFKKSHSVFHN